MMSKPSPSTAADHLVVVSRFRVDAPSRAGFLAAADEALTVLASRPGCLAATLGQSTDDPELLLVRTEWEGIGAYRRALSSFDVKVSAVPLLSLAIDEPSAYESVRVWDGTALRRAESHLAADAGDVRLGTASGPDVAPVDS
jgi:quinol monooxygenase YgiN